MCDAPVEAPQWQCSACDYQYNLVGDLCAMCEVINGSAPSEGTSLTSEGVLRRRLRRDWNNGASVVEIHRKYGVVVYRNCLDAYTQSLLFDDCCDKLNRISMPGMPIGTKSGPTHGYSYQTGWAPTQTEDKRQGSPSCLELATRLHAGLIAELCDDVVAINAKQTNAALKLPDAFEAHSLFARQYTAAQGLGFHLDPPGCEWAFIISLGCDTHFQVYGEHEKGDAAVDIVLKSGDAVFFNGTHVHHGIKTIVAGTHPHWWKEGAFDRVGLQMRAYKAPTASSALPRQARKH